MIAITAATLLMQSTESTHENCLPSPCTVLITGAGKRVGRSTAIELARHGCNLVLTYRTSERECNETADLAREAASARGATIAVRVAHLDLNDLASVARLAASCESGAKHAAIDAIVHNASAYRASEWGTITAAHLEEFHRAEVVAPLLLTQALRHSLSTSKLPGGGAVVLYSDIHVLGRARAGFAGYTLAKSAVETLARVLAVELAPNARVHCVAPGVVLWPQDFPQETKERILSRTPLARAGTAEDAARLVRFLILEAAYMTGETIRLDGGRSIR